MSVSKERIGRVQAARLAALLLLLLAVAPGAGAQEAAHRQRPDAYYEEMEKIGLFSSMTEGLIQGETLTRLDPAKPMVALTFDDGPGKHTIRLLRLLTQYDARGTFFLVGERVEMYPVTIARIWEQGSELGTHSLSHKNLTKLDREGIEADLRASIAMIEETAGAQGAPEARVTLMRPPYGSINEDVKSVCQVMELPIIRWSVDTEDWQSKDVDKIYEAALAHVNDGSIILFHDIYEQTVDALERIVPALHRKGYQLVTVSELLAHSQTQHGGGIVIERADR